MKTNILILTFCALAISAASLSSCRPSSSKVAANDQQHEVLFRHIDTPWVKVSDDTITTDNGQTTYRNTLLISAPELRQGHFVLDLGSSAESTTITVNGNKLSHLSQPPYRIDITSALVAGENVLDLQYAADSLPAGPVDILLLPDWKQPYTSIRPGQLWLDTNGKPIQAHGFQVMEHEGTYYWYGENKERTTRGSHVWTYGIRCYTSTDLYNWQDRGLIIPPDTINALSPLHYSQDLDRPHIIRSPKTGKWVCWIKSMDEDGFFVILEAEDFLGPYRYVRSLKPEGYGVGDFDMYVDPDTGKGYVWFERPHWELICAELTDDCLDVTPRYSSHFVGMRPPYTREAPTHFVVGGKHFMFTSGTTGYYSNVSMIASFDDYHGAYTDLGNPHPSDPYNHSFCSQITDVVKVPGRNLYVAVADRWMPQIADTDIPTQIARQMEVQYKDHQPFERDFTTPTPKDKSQNVRTDWDVTYNATYVFLPITFNDEGVPQIEWHDEWRIEDYDAK